MTVTHRFVDAGDARIHYVDCVPDGGSPYPPMLVLPGGPGASAAFYVRHMRRLHLDRLGLRQVYVDHRCIGRSTGRLESFRLDRLAEDLERIRKDLGVEQVGLWGGSFGGFLALTTAATFPASVAFLVALDTAASAATHLTSATDYVDGHGTRAQRAAWRRRVEVIDGNRPWDPVEDCVDWATLWPLYVVRARLRFGKRLFAGFSRTLGRWPRLYPTFVRLARRVGFWHEVCGAWLVSEWRSYDVRDRIGGITAPTLVLCGAEDWICPVPESRIIVNGIPRAELAIIPRAGHDSTLDTPGVVAARVRDFLERRVPKGASA